MKAADIIVVIFAILTGAYLLFMFVTVTTALFRHLARRLSRRKATPETVGTTETAQNGKRDSKPDSSNEEDSGWLNWDLTDIAAHHTPGDEQQSLYLAARLWYCLRFRLFPERFDKEWKDVDPKIRNVFKLMLTIVNAAITNLIHEQDIASAELAAFLSLDELEQLADLQPGQILEAAEWLQNSGAITYERALKIPQSKIQETTEVLTAALKESEEPNFKSDEAGFVFRINREYIGAVK